MIVHAEAAESVPGNVTGSRRTAATPNYSLHRNLAAMYVMAPRRRVVDAVA
jgi:hypothetical protein